MHSKYIKHRESLILDQVEVEYIWHDMVCLELLRAWPLHLELVSQRLTSSIAEVDKRPL